jgi:hypothetical protein
MEPERKIEKLLRAYANKRRAGAGEPLKLDPVARRRLHEEIARRAAKPEAEESVSLWQLLRAQWAFLFGFALIVFCLAAIFLPALSAAKKRAQNVTVLSKLGEIGAAAQMAAANANGKLPASLDALTIELGSSQSLIDPASGKPFVFIAGGRNLDVLETNAVLAYASEDKNGRPVLLANGTVEYASPARFKELTNQVMEDAALAWDRKNTAKSAEDNLAAASPSQNSSLAPPPGAIGLPMVSPVPKARLPAKADSVQPGVSGSQTFARRTTDGLQNLFRNKSHSARTAAVLENFQMEQTVDGLRVVDGDGSVYQGSWQLAKVHTQNAPVEQPNGIANNSLKENYQQKLPSNNGVQVTAQNYLFQVAGTNVTLNQKVVFSGNLVIVSAIPPAQTVTASNFQADNEKQQSLSDYPQQILWSNARIEGTAVVGDTNQTEIDASPP